MTVRVRFAPSPTGYLHIGGARTALFNWLFARHHGGKFLLRIEDTDRQRSTPESVEKIIEGLEWLNIDWDEDVVYQFERQQRHADVAKSLVENGHAYYCYASKEELEAMREEAQTKGLSRSYNNLWRDRSPEDAPEGAPPTIRLKTPLEGSTELTDMIKGTVNFPNADIDDMILLRSDGTPTYLLSVVVDDHDMGITHIIRGDDHFTNTFRMLHIYEATGWPKPQFAHLPLIHTAEGKKMSKRHASVAVDDYRLAGYLPEGLISYLMGLGWSLGDDEIIDRETAIKNFDINKFSKSPARFDSAKLNHINAQYMRNLPVAELMQALAPFWPDDIGEEAQARFEALLPELVQRASTLKELVEISGFILYPADITVDATSAALLTEDARSHLKALLTKFKPITDWDFNQLKDAAQSFCKENSLKMGEVFRPLRVVLTGSAASPGGIFEIMTAYGRDLSLQRMEQVLGE